LAGTIPATHALAPRPTFTRLLRFRAEGGYVREVISHFVFFAERILGPTRLIWARPDYPGDPALCETHSRVINPSIPFEMN